MAQCTKILIDASNIHTGGGKILLDDFLLDAVKFKSLSFEIWIDRRYKFPIEASEAKNISFHQTSFIDRFKIRFLLKTLAEDTDLILYFGNIPPFSKSACASFLLLQNRFIIDNFKIDDTLWNRARVALERMLFKNFKNNVDEIIVQSTSMSFLINKFKNNRFKTTVLAYKNLEENKLNQTQTTDSFIYVSSDDPHKNHERLVDSWILLSKENIFPNLILTIPSESRLISYLEKKKAKYSLNIELLIGAKREEVLEKFAASKALIFPSLIESYGLPLVEAKMLGLDVLASEMDYVRDIIDPSQTFDPYSSLSISRAVKRYLGKNYLKTEIVSSEEFIKYLLK